jgi:hypothetical protein
MFLSVSCAITGLTAPKTKRKNDNKMILFFFMTKILGTQFRPHPKKWKRVKKWHKDFARIAGNERDLDNVFGVFCGLPDERNHMILFN